MSEFGFGEVRDYQPQHGDIDWVKLYNATHPDNQEPPIWFENTDELGLLQVQCHQENTVIWLNRADPKFDCICIADPRDGNAFWFSRDKIGDERFSQIVAAVRSEVLVAEVKYPTLAMVNYVLMCAFRELDTMGQEDGAA
ncbi:MAG: hypothetical protein QFB87_04430 [Patescibacteria group bacterium]|nr:hypothetical protein [Patescibacteria group bacterium]